MENHLDSGNGLDAGNDVIICPAFSRLRALMTSFFTLVTVFSFCLNKLQIKNCPFNVKLKPTPCSFIICVPGVMNWYYSPVT